MWITKSTKPWSLVCETVWVELTVLVCLLRVKPNGCFSRSLLAMVCLRPKCFSERNPSHTRQTKVSLVPESTSVPQQLCGKPATLWVNLSTETPAILWRTSNSVGYLTKTKGFNFCSIQYNIEARCQTLPKVGVLINHHNYQCWSKLFAYYVIRLQITKLYKN